MCFGFGCCGPPPWATFKAYSNVSPFGLDFYDDRDGGAGGLRETAICDWNDETGYTIGVLCSGDGSEVTGITNEKTLIERDSDDGDRQTESTSSPLQAVAGSKCTLLKVVPVSGPSGGVWACFNSRLQFFDLDLVQQCDPAVGIAGFGFGAPSVVPTSVGCRDSLNLIAGYAAATGLHGQTKVLAREYSTTGTKVAELTRLGLTGSSGGGSMQALIPRDESASSFLVYGNNVGSGSGSRRALWTVSKTAFGTTVAGTPIAGTDGYQFLKAAATLPGEGGFQRTEIGRASRITSTHAILHLLNGTLVCVDMSTPAEAWTKSDKPREFVAVDSSQVYTVDPTAGELSAVNLSTGVEAWTLDLSDVSKLGTGTGDVLGSVLASGNLAVWRHFGVTIFTPGGTEVATVDVGGCSGIVEKSSRWLIVGSKRTTSS